MAKERFYQILYIGKTADGVDYSIDIESYDLAEKDKAIEAIGLLKKFEKYTKDGENGRFRLDLYEYDLDLSEDTTLLESTDM